MPEPPVETVWNGVGPHVSREDISGAVRRLGISAGDALFAHSSLSAFGQVDGGAPAVCAALLDAVGSSGTVAMPTFTWTAYHDDEVVVFDTRKDATECGAIPEAFRQLPGTLRSEHVCHSVAARGPLAEAVMGEGVLPFGRGSSLYRIYELDFWYVFLGCGFECCTGLHTVEELMAVPYRYYRHFKGSTVIRGDGSYVPSRAREFLRYRPYRNDFGKMEAIYRSRGLLRETSCGSALLLALKTRPLVDTGLALLRENLAFFLTERSQAYFKATKEVSCNE